MATTTTKKKPAPKVNDDVTSGLRDTPPLSDKFADLGLAPREPQDASTPDTAAGDPDQPIATAPEVPTSAFEVDPLPAPASQPLPVPESTKPLVITQKYAPWATIDAKADNNGRLERTDVRLVHGGMIMRTTFTRKIDRAVFSDSTSTTFVPGRFRLVGTPTGEPYKVESL